MSWSAATVCARKFTTARAIATVVASMFVSAARAMALGDQSPHQQPWCDENNLRCRKSVITRNHGLGLLRSAFELLHSYTLTTLKLLSFLEHHEIQQVLHRLAAHSPRFFFHILPRREAPRAGPLAALMLFEL